MQLILTVMAEDKPGIVERLSDVIAEHNANWLDSRLAHMAGKFAGIIKINSTDSNLDALKNALQSLHHHGIRVDCAIGSEQENQHPVLSIEITGHDRQGIVKEVTACLANLQVNILDFQSSCYAAAMSSETMFSAKLHIQLADNTDHEQLETALEALSGELVVDWLD